MIIPFLAPGSVRRLNSCRWSQGIEQDPTQSTPSFRKALRRPGVAKTHSSHSQRRTAVIASENVTARPARVFMPACLSRRRFIHQILAGTRPEAHTIPHTPGGQVLAKRTGSGRAKAGPLP